ncbi:restriction endonuclease subunit S, partial [Schleiferilactobacillus perolens]|uniref:restriction endonuclease subunit S n=1 Tax=Schleiferilactobacillus perolens TaxID=100468 RepID=UPI0039EB4730
MGELIKEHDQIATGEQYPIATSSRRGLFPQSEYFDGKRAGDNKKMEFHVVPDGYVTYRLMSDDSVFHFNQNLTGAPIQVSKEYPVFTAKPGTNMGFVVYNLNHSDSFKKFSHIRKKGGTRVRLYLKVLKAYLISIPGNAEQDQIASFFCILDSTIALHQRQLDQLHALKQELLKRLFPQYGNQHPQIRFTG